MRQMVPALMGFTHPTLWFIYFCRQVQHLDGSRNFLEFVGCHFAISQDLSKKSSPDILATMNRNNGTSAIRMLEKMMTAFDADNYKPDLAQSTYKPTASEGWKGAHGLAVNGYTLDTNKLI